MAYEKLIDKFLYTEFPYRPVATQVRFEAIFDAIIGTKQLRYGPRPSPEVQVAVRDIIRASNDQLHFFIPWASRKQDDSATVDVLEFMAIKQLSTLREQLLSFGLDSQFHFRLEDATDAMLFDEYPGWPAHDRIDQYRSKLESLIGHMLPGSLVRRETELVEFGEFKTTAVRIAEQLLVYWRGGPRPLFLLHDFSANQLRYFDHLYAGLYPADTEDERSRRLGMYFACAFARRQLDAHGLPDEPFIFLTFSHPIPDDPVSNNRMHYRTLPDRFTHTHKAPWLARGYFEINETNGSIVPRFRSDAVEPDIVHGEVTWQGVDLCADYVVLD